ncbi:hypothetical protein ABID99_000821 [Mucilaginibacter sp. OAE612]|uniref:hypothetical protein n=1 Tax=Mucilaginibacter sp. OAE612 TaxID=3156444 RepID=UPI00359CEA7D
MISKQAQNQTPSLILKQITIIHLALVAGQILFGIVVFAIGKQQPLNPKNDALIYVMPAIALGCFLVSMLLPKNMIGNIKNDQPLLAKLKLYQTAFIIRMALLEGPSLFGIVCFLLTNNVVFISISAALVLYAIYQRPTRQKIEDDLNLGYEEKAEFEGTDKAY